MLVLIFSLIASAPVNPPSTIYIEDGPHAPALGAQIDRELPPGTVVSRYAADLWISLEERRDQLIVEARDRGGDLILRREIPFEGDVAPALRVAALLITEAARNVVQPPPVITTTVAAVEPIETAVRLDTAAIPRSFRTGASPVVESAKIPLDLYLAVSVIGAWWRAPALSPQPGLGLSLFLKREAWRAGLEIAGMCCSRESAGVRASSLEMALWLTAAIDLFRFEGGTVLLTASAGFSWIQAEARAVVPLPEPIQGTPETYEAFQAVGIVAPALSVPLWASTALEVRAGARITGNYLDISPPSIPGAPAGEGLIAGPITPFVEASLPLKLF